MHCQKTAKKLLLNCFDNKNGASFFFSFFQKSENFRECYCNLVIVVGSVGWDKLLRISQAPI